MWRGDTNTYILNWLDKVRIYHTIAKEKFGTEQLRVMLENALHPIDDLCQVRSTANQLKLTTGNEVDFEGYKSLLLSASQTYHTTELPH